jgi:hypothetical protein
MAGEGGSCLNVNRNEPRDSSVEIQLYIQWFFGTLWG